MAQTRSQALLLRFSRGSSTAVIVTGVIVLIGWALKIRWFTGLPTEFVPMNPSSAILFILSGIALRRRLSAPSRELTSKRDWIALAFAAIVTVSGACKLKAYWFPIEFNFDRWLFPHWANSTMPPSEIAPNSALTFLLCGLGLWLLDVRWRDRFRPAQLCFLLAALIGLLALIGYLYRVLPLYRFGSAMPMPLVTAFAFELLCLGALAARPDQGVMRVITSDTTAGATARRLLPAAILIPLLLGVLRFTSDRHGIVEVEFGVSLFAVANMVLFAVLIWWNSRLLFTAEQERLRIERRLAVQYGVTRTLADSPDITMAVHTIIKDICERLGWPAGGVWRVDEKAQLLRCEDFFYTSPELSGFATSTKKLSFSPGAALIGRVWEKGSPVWITEIRNDPEFSRSLAASEAGLRTLVAFPIRYDGTVCGVMEFFSTQAEPRDEPLLQTLSAVGFQIGQFVERKRADEKLKQTSADLERSNTELQQFAYVASHDLSEPLRMIVSYLQLLSDRHQANLNAEARDFIGYAVDGARRMQTMIHDLLAYARLDNGEREFQLASSEEILAAAVQNLKVVIEETGAAVERAPLPMVKCDPIQLVQVFQNLISNALKFRGKAAPVIVISARKEGGEIVFSVKDNGIGIEPRNFARIFELFQRLHTRKEYPGTGIGLSVVKKIIDRHGGRLWLESERGQGTTFFFTVPAHD